MSWISDHAWDGDQNLVCVTADANLSPHPRMRETRHRRDITHHDGGFFHI
jgi:hypothetical protein